MPVGTNGVLSVGFSQTFASTAFSEASSFVTWSTSHPVDGSSSNQRTVSEKPECLAAP